MLHSHRWRALAFIGSAVALTATASAQYSVGDQWLRAADFEPGVSQGSTSGNPGPGFDGTPVWRYEMATGGGGLGSGSEWFRQPTTTMTWDGDWWGIGQGAWSAGDDVNPPVFRNRLTHNVSAPNHQYVPMVRWMNPGGDGMQVDIGGAFNVRWTGHESVGAETDVELVIARESSAGAIDVLFSDLLSKQTPGLSIGDNIDVPIDLSQIALDEGDSLIFSGRGADSTTGVGRWIDISDQITIKVAVPAPGALALLGAAGLACARRRRA